MRGRLLPALAVGAALWVVAVSALAAGLSALGWWSPWVGWPVAVAVGVAAGWVVRGIPGVRMPSAAAVALVAVVVGFAVWAGVDALGTGAAPARRGEQPPGRRQPRDDPHARRTGRCGLGRRIRGARPARSHPGEPGVLRGGVQHRPGRAAAVRRRAGGGLRLRVVGGGSRGHARAAGPGDGPRAAGPRPARRPGRRTVGGRRGGSGHRHPLPGAAHRAGDVLRAAGDARP